MARNVSIGGKREREREKEIERARARKTQSESVKNIEEKKREEKRE